MSYLTHLQLFISKHLEVNGIYKLVEQDSIV